jgi:hypothetical protein
MKQIWQLLTVVGGAAYLAACGPKAISEPPPQNPTSVPTPADAGPPVVPLSGGGVIVPSDVKLETPPKQATPPAGMTPATASPSGT